jgi:hypothetical protein
LIVAGVARGFVERKLATCNLAVDCFCSMEVGPEGSTERSLAGPLSGRNRALQTYLTSSILGPGETVMASHTIKVTGVSDELLRLLDQRIQDQHATGRAEYIRELIRRDVLPPESRPRARSFQEIVAPVHAATPPGETESESEQFVDDLIAAVRRERRQKQSSR